MEFFKWFVLCEGRDPAGYFTFQHLLTVTISTVIFFGSAILCSFLFKKNAKNQNLFILIAGIALVVVYLVELVSIIAVGIYKNDNIVKDLFNNLPLFLCDFSIILVPIAAFSKNRFRDILFDFIAIWGLVMGIVGNYFAGNIFGTYPALSLPCIISVLNHSVSGAVALFIWFSRLNKMEIKNIPWTMGMFTALMLACIDIGYAFRFKDSTIQNYMFCFGGDGTPFDLLAQLVGYDQTLGDSIIDIITNNQVAQLIMYQILTYLSQMLYMTVVYVLYHTVVMISKKNKNVNKDLKVKTA